MNTNPIFPQKDFEILWNVALKVLEIDRFRSYIIDRYYFERDKKDILLDKLFGKFEIVNDLTLFIVDKDDKKLYPSNLYSGLYNAVKLAIACNDKKVFCKFININPEGLNFNF